MMRLTRGLSCKGEVEDAGVAAPRAPLASELPSIAESAAPPMPAAELPKKCRRVTGDRFSIGCGSFIARVSFRYRSTIVASKFRIAWHTTVRAARLAGGNVSLSFDSPVLRNFGA